MTTHSLTRVAEILGIDQEMKAPERWLMRQIRARRIPARKIGRSWYMTDADIEAALDAFLSAPRRPEIAPERPEVEPEFPEGPQGLSRESMRRRLRRAS